MTVKGAMSAGPTGPVGGTTEPAPASKGKSRVSRAVRAKVAGSGALLLIVAAYHGSGYSQIVAASASLPEDLAVMTGGLWLFFSWHLTVLGAAALLTALAGRGWGRPVVLFCAFVTAGDFFWVYGIAGWFPGTVLLVLAALGLLVGALLWRPRTVVPAPERTERRRRASH